MWFTKKRPSSAPIQRRAFQPRLERLEDRSLMSGGVLDPTFGTNGVVTTNVASFDASGAYAVATYPKAGTANDGKIVAAGAASSYGSGQIQDMAVVRYNLDGSLDKSFGGSGQVTTSVGSSNDGAGDVIVQPDGKVVVAGWTGGSGSNFALVRYNVDGSLDTSFGGTKAKGVVTTDINNSRDSGWVMALQADGKIVVAGTTIPKNSTTTVDLALVRYNADGSLDSSFGTGGKVTRHFSAPLAANIHGGIDLAIDPNTNPLDPYAAKIVVAAQLTQGPMVVVRLNTNGSPDTSFGNNGAGYVSITTLNGGDAAAVAVQSDDRIVVAGINPGTPSTGQDIGLARFNPDGTADTTFGSGGIVVSRLPNNERARSLAIQPDGKIVVAGDSYDLSLTNGTDPFMVARYNAADGSLDTSFGTGSIALSTGFNVIADKVDVALEPDGRIVVAGTTPVGSGRFALARLLATGPQIGSFTASQPSAAAPVALTASNITDSNPASSIIGVSFYYYDSSGNKVVLGTVSTPDSSGDWTLMTTLPPGTYTLYAQAEDNYGAFADAVLLTLTVQWGLLVARPHARLARRGDGPLPHPQLGQGGHAAHGRHHHGGRRGRPSVHHPGGRLAAGWVARDRRESADSRGGQLVARSSRRSQIPLPPVSRGTAGRGYGLPPTPEAGG